MAYGFQTSDCSIYVLDPQGRTRRFKRSNENEVEGWASPSYCAYIKPFTGEGFIISSRYVPQEKVINFKTWGDNGGGEFLSFSSTESPLPLPKGHKYISIHSDDPNSKTTEASLFPAVGAIPLEKSSPAKHCVGKTITSIFETVYELRDAFRSAGVKKLRLPPEYIAELKKADAGASAETKADKPAETFDERGRDRHPSQDFREPESMLERLQREAKERDLHHTRAPQPDFAQAPPPFSKENAREVVGNAQEPSRSNVEEWKRTQARKEAERRATLTPEQVLVEDKERLKQRAQARSNSRDFDMGR